MTPAIIISCLRLVRSPAQLAQMRRLISRIYGKRNHKMLLRQLPRRIRLVLFVGGCAMRLVSRHVEERVVTVQFRSVTLNVM